MMERLAWLKAFEVRKEPLLWALGGIASFVGFFLLTFPYGSLESRTLSEIRQATGWDIRASEWSRGFPVAVEWNSVSLTRPGAPLIQLESMRLSIPLLVQLFGQRSVEASMRFPGNSPAGAGRLSGVVTGSSWTFQGPMTLTGRAHQIDLAQVVRPYVTRGLFDATVAQRWVGTSSGGIEFKGDGTWKTEIKDLLLEHVPVGSGTLPTLAFSRITLALTCRDALCDVSEFKGDGPDGSVTGQGRVALRYPLQLSSLDLTFTVVTGSGWAQKSAGLPIPPLPPGTPLTLKLVGSVANPRLSV